MLGNSVLANDTRGWSYEMLPGTTADWSPDESDLGHTGLVSAGMTTDSLIGCNSGEDAGTSAARARLPGVKSGTDGCVLFTRHSRPSWE